MGKDEFAEILTEMIGTDGEEFFGEQVTVRSFREEGLLTRDEGLVVKVGGEKFYLTIQKG